MTHVALIQTRTVLDEPVIYPIGLACLAPYLSKHEVRGFDLNGPYADPWRELRGFLGDFKPELVGISMRNIKIARPGVHVSAVAEFERAFREVRKQLPKATIVAGGAAFSLYGELLMKRYQEIDFGVFGEGEEILPALVEGQSPAEVPGLFYREAGRVAFTGPPQRLDFSASLGPDYGLFELSFYARTPFSVGVQSKRGCALSCIHCSDRFLLGNRIARRSPVRVVDDIARLSEHGVSEVFIADQIFNIPMSHAEAICDELLSRSLKVKWLAWFNERQLSRQFMEKAWQAGIQVFNFSPDSVSKEILKVLKKNTRPEDINQAVVLCKELGAKATYNFMVNGPEETFGSLFRLVRFLLWAKWQLGSRLKLHGSFVLAMRIYPHTELRDIALKKGLIQEDDDLLEPRYYNPAPLRYIVAAATKLLALAWNFKQHLRRSPPQPTAPACVPKEG